MASGTPLSELLLMLKAEIGDSLTTGVNAANDPLYRRLLSNKQKWLAHEYDFPNLQAEATVSLTQGTRFYTFPTSISRDRPVLVEALEGTNFWIPLEYGIGAEQFITYNSDLGQQGFPIFRWQFNNDGSTPLTTLDRIEVWPIPNQTTSLRITGQIVLPALVQDTDKAVLDDMLIVLFTAADYLARNDQPDAQLKLAEAQRLARQLSFTLPRKLSTFKIGGGSPGTTRGVRRIHIQAQA